LQQFTFGIKHVKGSENFSDSLSRVDMNDLKNKSFDYNFSKHFLDETHIALNVIHVSNSQLEESKEIYIALFYGLKHRKLLRILPLTRLLRKGSRSA